MKRSIPFLLILFIPPACPAIAGECPEGFFPAAARCDKAPLCAAGRYESAADKCLAETTYAATENPPSECRITGSSDCGIGGGYVSAAPGGTVSGWCGVAMNLTATFDSSCNIISAQTVGGTYTGTLGYASGSNWFQAHPNGRGWNISQPSYGCENTQDQLTGSFCLHSVDYGPPDCGPGALDSVSDVCFADFLPYAEAAPGPQEGGNPILANFVQSESQELAGIAASTLTAALFLGAAILATMIGKNIFVRLLGK